jgi:hypothetical protein
MGIFLKVRSLFVFLASYVFDGIKGGYVFEITWVSILHLGRTFFGEQSWLRHVDRYILSLTLYSRAIVKF